MALTFRQVRYFIATAEAGKVSLAAANLNVSQSAITSAIKTLEGIVRVNRSRQLPLPLPRWV